MEQQQLERMACACGLCTSANNFGSARTRNCVTFPRPSKFATCALVLRARKWRVVLWPTCTYAAEYGTTKQAKKKLFFRNISWTFTRSCVAASVSRICPQKLQLLALHFVPFYVQESVDRHRRTSTFGLRGTVTSLPEEMSECVSSEIRIQMQKAKKLTASKHE